MRNFKYIYFFSFLFFFHPIKSGENNLVFHGAYSFESFSGQKTGAFYVSIFNNTNKDFIINSLSSEIAKNVEIHEMLFENEIMRMKKVDKLLIKANEQKYFQPGGMHIMLMGLKKELIDGSHFFINFLINNVTEKRVKVMVLNKKLRENFIE